MAKEIYISTTPHETRLAIVEDEQLAEIYYERENEYTLAGSIYNGKVTRVLPGMQSSFVDIGLERDAFLYVTDFMEEQGDAEFDSDSAPKAAAPREETRADGRGERRNRGDREKGGRDRNRPAATPVPETQSFDEPVAPHPVEVSAAETISEDGSMEGQGSRRWRGRRGRRRGRNFREGDPLPGAQADNSGSEIVSPEELPETIVLEGSSFEEDAALSGESDWAEELPEEPEPPTSEADAAYALRRSTRREEIRRGRKRGDADPVETSPVSDAVPASSFDPVSRSVPFVLPGESIRKYRDPVEGAREEEAGTASLPAQAVAASAPSLEIVGWDGGAVLPGETLSRHRRQEKAAPAVARERFTEAKNQSAPPIAEPHESETPSKTEAAPEHAAPLTEASEDSHGPAAMESAEDAVAAPPTEWKDLAEQASYEVPVPPAGEYEPTEGESASLGDVTRRDLRRLEQRSEPEAVAKSEEAENAPEELAASPDATTYDLQSAGHEQVAVEPEVGEEAEVSSPAEVQQEHIYTTLQASGEMLSEPIEEVSEGLGHQPHSQDEDGLRSLENGILTEPDQDTDTRSVAEAGPSEDLAGPAVQQNPGETAGQAHAYGEGDLQEEELDGDEYEYDIALAAAEEEELDEYEEETLDDTADLGSVLHEMVADDHAVPVDDVDGAEYASGGETDEFTVEDFGGEPEEPSSDSPVNEAAPQEKRRGRQDSRRFGRERKPGGGFRGGSGGDRGRGRQSVQTMDLPAINELLKPGQEILVQIAKEPIAKKGARITSHIALPGRFLVFMPTVNHTGVSRKISSDEERRRLKSILLSEKGEAQGGFIVRTAAEGASEEELRNDLRFLIQLWQDIKMRSESSKSPALIYHDLSLVERILRDQVTDNFSAIWVDTESEYERVLRFLQRFQPSLVRRVKLYTKETPLFEHFGVTQEIDKALKSKVWLKSGGSIVINQTEALVAIDINTGKYVGKTARLEDTILKTNLDAIPEIVRQIRLRDLGGIIVIDFIDMDERKNRAKVMQVLEDELKSDRAPSKVLPFNDFGLVIMTRKRVKQSLERTLCIPDPITEGTGMIKSPITVANEIYVEMRKMYRHIEKADVMLRVHPEVVKQLKSSGGKRLQELEEMTHKTILVKSDPTLNPEQFDIH